MTTAGTAYSSYLLGFGIPGGYEWVILLILGLLIFGRRLPEVGRSLGKSIVEFKRGIKGIEGDIETESSQPPAALEPPEPQSTSPPPPAEPRLAAEPPANVVERTEVNETASREVEAVEPAGDDADQKTG